MYPSVGVFIVLAIGAFLLVLAAVLPLILLWGCFIRLGRIDYSLACLVQGYRPPVPPAKK